MSAGSSKIRLHQRSLLRKQAIHADFIAECCPSAAPKQIPVRRTTTCAAGTMSTITTTKSLRDGLPIYPAGGGSQEGKLSRVVIARRGGRRGTR
jgi:hypothetical protein